MVNLTNILTLVGMASAVHIDFRRYADDNCDQGHHIRKTSDLHDTTCKTFSHNELGFHSFDFKITKGHDDPAKKECRIVVFPERDCHGQGVTYGDMKGMENACAAVPMEGHSVKVECGPKVDPQVKLLQPKPEPKPTSTQKLTRKPTVTVTYTREAEHETMTVVPQPHNRVKVCHYEDPDDNDDNDWMQ